MLRARRPFSLGEHSLAPGEEVTGQMLAALPGRRLDLLVDQGYVERVSDSEVIADLSARVAKLERKPARKKVAA